MPYTGPEPARRPLSSDDITDGIISTADLADNAVTAAKVSTDVPQLGKNLIINGAMTVAQRGTSETSVFGSASGYGGWPDRFRAERASGSESGRATFSQDSSGPAGFANCLKVEETTTDASPGAGDLYRVTTRVEAQNLQHLAYGNAAAKTVTLSFWVFCNLTGAFTVTFNQPDASRTYSTTYTVNASNTWEKKTITVPGDASGTINDDNGSGFEIGWTLGSGSNFQGGTQGSWATNANNMFGAGMTNNVLGSSSGDWRITGVQLEVGSVATDFEHEPYSATFAKCLRYYYRMTGNGSGYHIASTYNAATTVAEGGMRWPVEMRVAPTIGKSADGDFFIRDTGGEVAVTTLGSTLSSTFSVRWEITCSGGGLTDGYGSQLVFDSTSGNYIDFSAEL